MSTIKKLDRYGDTHYPIPLGSPINDFNARHYVSVMRTLFEVPHDVRLTPPSMSNKLVLGITEAVLPIDATGTLAHYSNPHGARCRRRYMSLSEAWEKLQLEGLVPEPTIPWKFPLDTKYLETELSFERPGVFHELVTFALYEPSVLQTIEQLVIALYARLAYEKQPSEIRWVAASVAKLPVWSGLLLKEAGDIVAEFHRYGFSPSVVGVDHAVIGCAYPLHARYEPKP